MRYFFTLLFMMMMSAPATAQEAVTYEPLSYQSLMSALWKFNYYDPQDRDILDEYARIVNCGLFESYYSDDFEWERVRSGLRREIQYHANSYPDRYFVNALITVDRYDFEKSAFIISSDYKLNNAGSIEMPLPSSPIRCESNKTYRLFPRDVEFSADNSFSLTEIPVPPDRAQDILNTIAQYRYPEIRHNINKVIPLRFKIKINGIRSIRQATLGNILTFYGQLDDITFYEDPEMTKPIWGRSFKSFADVREAESQKP